MKQTDLLVIDYQLSGVKRYALAICKALKEKRNDTVITFGYVVGNGTLDSTYIDNIIALADYNYDASKIITEWNPKSVLVFAHRFVDYMFTIEAHKKGIMVANFQHGIYMDSQVLSSLSISNILKVFENKADNFKVYLRCIYNMSEKSVWAFVKLLFDFVKYKSIYSVMNRVYGKFCNADISFIFGNYWKNFYVKQYLEETTEFFVVGYPELEEANKLVTPNYFTNSKLPIICYLAQSSVEDGAIDKSDLNIFLSNMLEKLKGINLVLKLHPRSDKSLYKPLLESEYSEHVKLWEEQSFPVTDAYIGHESTVAARALSLTNKVLIYRLRVDRTSPFEKFTKFVATEYESFDVVLNSMLKSEKGTNYSTPELNDYVYWNKDKGAINETANIIYDKIKNL